MAIIISPKDRNDFVKEAIFNGNPDIYDLFRKKAHDFSRGMNCG